MTATATWDEVLAEARVILESEPDFLGALLNSRILRHSSFAAAIKDLMVNHFLGDSYYSTKCVGLCEETWTEVVSSCFIEGVEYEDGQTAESMGLLDLAAVRDRDPAAGGLVNPLLYFKGYKAIQAHRMAHILWRSGKKTAALAIQSRASELFAVDIHPAAKIGAGLMIDHGTGIVIGETAVIGSNCSFLHGVTLGGTRKIGGNRHPKLGNDVLIGCCATLLGNIQIDSNAKIGSGSVVLTSLPSCVTAVGNPARIVGKTLDKHAASSMDLSLKNVQYCIDMKAQLTDQGILSEHVNLDPVVIFEGLAREGDDAETITIEQFRTALGLRFGMCPSAEIMSALCDGRPTLTADEYLDVSNLVILRHSEDPRHSDAMAEWDAQVDEGGNLSKFLLALARLEVDGSHPDSSVEVAGITGQVLTDLNLAGIGLDLDLIESFEV